MSAERYRPAYGEIGRLPDPIAAIEVLSDLPADWDRDGVCGACERWQPKHGLSSYPRRPGALDNTVSCHGCLFSMMDEVQPRAQVAPPPPPRRRVLLLQSHQIRWSGGRLQTEAVTGYTGPRNPARAARPEVASFAPRPRPDERRPCPVCHVACPVEQYWSLGSGRQEPVAVLVYHCPGCGRQRVAGPAGP